MERSLPDERLWISLRQALEAWTNGDGSGVKVAVVDSGVDTTHPALAGLDLADDIAIHESDEGPKIVDLKKPHGDGGGGIRQGDLFGHGTAIAYLIRKSAPKAEIGSFRVLGPEMKGKGEVVRAGVKCAIDRGYRILNCSFGFGDGGYSGTGKLRFVERHKAWVDGAYLRNIHIVSACNNGDFRRIEWPGHFATSITVDKENCEEDDFFYRPDSLVEFAAKGYDVRVPWLNSSWNRVTGSSYAAPRVSGGIARLLSVHPRLSAPQVKALLRHISLERPFLGIRSKQL
jgi:subtilisin family serine protease